MLVAIVETLRERVSKREGDRDRWVCVWCVGVCYFFCVLVYIYWVLWCLSVRCEWNCGRWIFMMMRIFFLV